MRPIVAGNWKMFKTLDEAREYVENISNLLLNIYDTDVIFCPPFTALFGIKEMINNSSAFLGAQNCHWERSGAFTGEISVEMLKSMDVDHVILGHSERRHIFNESDTWINKKVIAALNGGLKPILCIGETLDERKQGKTNDVLRGQLTSGLKDVKSASDLVIAYEPVWAIGTGLNADQKQINEAHTFVKDELVKLFGEVMGNNIPVLYGGSVKPENAGELFSVKNVNGFLVGGASLKVDDFFEIITKVENLQRGK